MNLARKLVEKAKEIGCSAVKFQSFKAEKLASKKAPKVDYQKLTSDLSESHFDMLKSLEFKEEQHYEIIEFCKKIGIEFISTAYDAEAVSFLNKLGVKKIKTASADLIDHTIHKKIAETKMKPIVAVGMASFDEISETLDIYKKKNMKPTLLHCVSNYPCKHESINLLVLKRMKELFQVPIGYSDHSIGFEAAMLSVAFGSTIIEKHFTLDKSMPGPDHAASSTPEELAELVEYVKLAEKILGTAEKKLQTEEEGMFKFSRKSVFAQKQIRKDEEFSEDNLCLLRPGTGIPANKFYSLLGKKSLRDIEALEMLSAQDVEK